MVRLCLQMKIKYRHVKFTIECPSKAHKFHFVNKQKKNVCCSLQKNWINNCVVLIKIFFFLFDLIIKTHPTLLNFIRQNDQSNEVHMTYIHTHKHTRARLRRWIYLCFVEVLEHLSLHAQSQMIEWQSATYSYRVWMHWSIFTINNSSPFIHVSIKTSTHTVGSTYKFDYRTAYRCHVVQIINPFWRLRSL